MAMPIRVAGNSRPAVIGLIRRMMAITSVPSRNSGRCLVLKKNTVPPSTSMSVIWVFPNTYSTFPSKDTFILCASNSPGLELKALAALYNMAKPASVPIQISPSKSAAIAVMFLEGRFPELMPVRN